MPLLPLFFVFPLTITLATEREEISGVDGEWGSSWNQRE